MHEVGHTLGLRHNFKASSAYSLENVNNPDFTREHANAVSVMDYLPVNFAPRIRSRATTSPDDRALRLLGDRNMLQANQGRRGRGAQEDRVAIGRQDLTYGTDEDLFLNPDPRINAFDLGDPLDYAKQRIEIVKEGLKELETRVVAEGEGWQRAREAFSMLLGELASASSLTAQYVGGEYTSLPTAATRTLPRPSSRLPSKPSATRWSSSRRRSSRIRPSTSRPNC